MSSVERKQCQKTKEGIPFSRNPLVFRSRFTNAASLIEEPASVNKDVMAVKWKPGIEAGQIKLAETGIRFSAVEINSGS